MKIKEVNTNYILFDNGSRITFDHEQDCCETNYADFEQLEDLALEYEFENDLIFEVVPENGFRFGSKGTPMFFIPWVLIYFRKEIHPLIVVLDLILRPLSLPVYLYP